MKYKIYTLSDPITNEVRYIGKTAYSLKVRLCGHKSHCKTRNTKTTCWLKSLSKKSLEPLIEELDSTDSFEESGQLEILYISIFKAWGFNLTNHTEGGEGTLGLICSKETRKKIGDTISKIYKERGGTFKGRKHSSETKIKISKKLKGQKRSQEFRDKRKELQKNWKPSAYVILRMKEVHQKPVIQMDFNNNFINRFDSIKIASDITGVYETGISRCCNKTRKSAGGFRWKHE